MLKIISLYHCYQHQLTNQLSNVLTYIYFLTSINISYSFIFNHLKKSGGRGRSRTCDRLVRSQVLYPAELRVRNKLFFYISSLGDNEHAS